MPILSWAQQEESESAQELPKAKEAMTCFEVSKEFQAGMDTALPNPELLPGRVWVGRVRICSALSAC